MHTTPILAAGLAAGTLMAAPAMALSFDQDVTPGVIFGDGVANGGFTTDTAGGVELGLRGKLRFDANNDPQDIFNSNGDGSYSFAAGTPPTGFGFDPNSSTTPIWNFDFTVNSDVDGTTGNNLDAFTYLLQLDSDPGAGTVFNGSFDPINQTSDNAIGDNSTTEDNSTVASNSTSYANLIATNNVAQNSVNYEFLNYSGGPVAGFDPTVPGTYTIALSAFSGSSELARTEIDIDVVAPVPLPATLPLMLGALGLGGVAVRRRRRAG